MAAPPRDRPSPPREPSPYELARAAVENVLVAHCGACHGPPLTEQQALGRIWFIDDLDELTVQGYIVPLSSQRSRIVQVMRDGSMPPRNSGLDRVPDSEITLVEQFIDSPLFWPILVPAEPTALDAGSGSPPVDTGSDGG